MKIWLAVITALALCATSTPLIAAPKPIKEWTCQGGPDSDFDGVPDRCDECNGYDGNDEGYGSLLDTRRCCYDDGKHSPRLDV